MANGEADVRSRLVKAIEAKDVSQVSVLLARGASVPLLELRF